MIWWSILISSDSILCQHKWLILLVSSIFLIKEMPQFSKWPAVVKYTVRCSAWKKTFFCRKKVFSVVSMCTKKIFCVYDVFQNWYFRIFKKSNFDTQWVSFPINFFTIKKGQLNVMFWDWSRELAKKRYYTIPFLPDCSRHSYARWDNINDSKGFGNNQIISYFLLIFWFLIEIYESQ